MQVTGYAPFQISSEKNPIACVICNTDINRCSKCEIKYLRRLLRERDEVIQFLTNGNSEALKTEQIDELKVNKWIKQQWKTAEEGAPRGHLMVEELSNMWFITITFDPSKFGAVNDKDLEKNYILCSIVQLIRKFSIFYVYGSFEFQKNGAIHSHLILRSGEIIDIIKHLKKCFTNNPRNNKAIDYGPAKQKQSIDYINKFKDKGTVYEKKHFYSFNGFQPIGPSDSNVEFSH